ncbi:hypothetical protein V8E54_005041 [Elaphomyces granulatus]|jgi:hypothetical protein
MSRTIRNTGQLWLEWSLPGWHPQKERTFYYRRKVIIDNIKKKALSGRDIKQVIEELEKKRFEKEWSLSRLSRPFIHSSR